MIASWRQRLFWKDRYRVFLQYTSTDLDAADRLNIIELFDHGEWGLAHEHLMERLLEFGILLDADSMAEVDAWCIKFGVENYLASAPEAERSRQSRVNQNDVHPI